jgi:CheY-like chemotaxis protein
MNGQLRAESEKGRGSKFTFAFNFPIPNSVQTSQFLETTIAAGAAADTTQMNYSTPPTPERTMLRRQRSNDSVASPGTTSSGHSGRSEIDQLVGLIASPSLEEGGLIPRSKHIVKRRSDPSSERGELDVQDSRMPIRSVKIDEDEVDVPAAIQQVSMSTGLGLKSPVTLKPKKLRILVAEDDPVNQAILKKRLSMDGHDVVLTKDGAEVVDTYSDCWRDCDIILMDLQVSISMIWLMKDAGIRRCISHTTNS